MTTKLKNLQHSVVFKPVTARNLWKYMYHFVWTQYYFLFSHTWRHFLSSSLCTHHNVLASSKWISRCKSIYCS